MGPGSPGRVIRENYDTDTGPHGWTRDYLFAEGRTLAAIGAADGTRYYHPDHLGHTRAMSNGSSNLAALNHFYPFGEAAYAWNPYGQPLRFTGHERDDNLSGTLDDLDYMHARFYSPHLGRFMRVDPAAASFNPQKPQSWNRYAYTINNPMNLIDPTGAIVRLASDKNSQKLRMRIVATLQRPSARKNYEALAQAEDFTVTIRAGQLNAKEDVMQARQDPGGGVEIVFAHFDKESLVVEDGVLRAVDMVVDQNALSVHPIDTTGVATLAHESDHGVAMLNAILEGKNYYQTWAAGVRGDTNQCIDYPTCGKLHIWTEESFPTRLEKRSGSVRCSVSKRVRVPRR